MNYHSFRSHWAIATATYYGYYSHAVLVNVKEKGYKRNQNRSLWRDPYALLVVILNFALTNINIINKKYYFNTYLSQQLWTAHGAFRRTCTFLVPNYCQEFPQLTLAWITAETGKTASRLIFERVFQAVIPISTRKICSVLVQIRI